MLPSSTDRRKEEAVRARNRQIQKDYKQIFMWRQDFSRLRDLEHAWRRTRVQTIHCLLNLADQATGVRPVSGSRECWDRIAELAHRLNMPADELTSRVVELVSHCTADQVLGFLGQDQQGK